MMIQLGVYHDEQEDDSTTKAKYIAAWLASVK